MIGPGYLDAVGVPLDDDRGKADAVEHPLDPYTFEHNQTVFRAEMRVAFHAGIQPPVLAFLLAGEPSLIGSTRGFRHVIGWTRYSAGAAEARRDRRRFP